MNYWLCQLKLLKSNDLRLNFYGTCMFMNNCFKYIISGFNTISCPANNVSTILDDGDFDANTIQIQNGIVLICVNCNFFCFNPDES